jgi:hypothetical protein
VKQTNSSTSKTPRNLHHLPIENILEKTMAKTCRKFSTIQFSHLAMAME